MTWDLIETSASMWIQRSRTTRTGVIRSEPTWRGWCGNRCEVVSQMISVLAVLSWSLLSFSAGTIEANYWQRHHAASLLQQSYWYFYESDLGAEGLENDRDCSWSCQEWSRALVQKLPVTKLAPGQLKDMVRWYEEGCSLSWEDETRSPAVAGRPWRRIWKNAVCPVRMKQETQLSQRDRKGGYERMQSVLGFSYCKR